MTNDLRDRLAPLRELEPTSEQHARLRAAPARRPRRPVPMALATAAVAAATLAVVALPAGERALPSAVSALAAAAAAAAEQPGPADFTGYRYLEVLDHRESPWALPDEDCLRPARPGAGGRAPRCRVLARARYSEEGRQELWVDARWGGRRRDHGSRVTAATGDPELAAAIRRDLGRTPATIEYVYGEGPFARAPLAELPTEPGALLETLSAAFADGRWAYGGSLHPSVGEPARRFELASFIAHLLAESNASPALRGAAFGALARLDGVRDLGTVVDARGRDGHGIEVRGAWGPPEQAVPARLRVIFDPEAGEVLSWSRVIGAGEQMQRVEWVILRRGHVRELPPDVRVTDR